MMLMRNELIRRPARGLAAAAIGAVILATLAATPSARAQGATDVVKALVNPALQILADKQTPLKDRQEKLRNLVSGSFDYTAMSRSALGYQWRSLNDQQRTDFTQTFTAFIQDSYLRKIQDYSGQQVEFTGESQTSPGEAQVKSNILQSGKDPVPVNYMLRQDNGKWSIYDVTVDNISIIANYRNQFNRVINNQGFDALITDLKNKQQQLHDELGTSHSD